MVIRWPQISIGSNSMRSVCSYFRYYINSREICDDTVFVFFFNSLKFSRREDCVALQALSSRYMSETLNLLEVWKVNSDFQILVCKHFFTSTPHES